MRPSVEPSARPAPRRPFWIATGAVVVGAALIAGAALLVTNAFGGSPAVLGGGSNDRAEAKAALLLDVTMEPQNGAVDQSPATVVVLQTSDLQLERVELRSLAFRSLVAGHFESGRHEWRSATALQPGTTYAVDYTVKGSTGLVATGSGSFTTAPPGAALSGGLSSSPGGSPPSSSPSSSTTSTIPSNGGGSPNGSGPSTSTPGNAGPGNGSPGSRRPPVRPAAQEAAHRPQAARGARGPAPPAPIPPGPTLQVATLRGPGAQEVVLRLRAPAPARPTGGSPGNPGGSSPVGSAHRPEHELA